MFDIMSSSRQASRAPLSSEATAMVAAVAAMTFSASGAAPTPLYPLYQESLGLTPATLTVIFAAYVLSLLAALLTTGGLSDHVGRRPVILAALLSNVVAMLMFVTAGSAAALIAARAVQGFATGVATTALGAAILDNDRKRGAILNSVTAFAGLSVGSLVSGALVNFAPVPSRLVYLVLLALSAAEAAVLWRMPETASGRDGAFASFVPRVSVPVAARRTLLRLAPVTVASWALAGFYFSLMPSLVRAATGVTLPILGGLVVATLTLSAATAVLLFRTIAAERLPRGGVPALALGVAITLAGVRTELVGPMLLGTVVSGVGFGAAFSGTLRTILPLAKSDERAGLLSAFYVIGYLAFSLPAMLAGLSAPSLGLRAVATVYGAAVIGLALASSLAQGSWRGKMALSGLAAIEVNRCARRP